MAAGGRPGPPPPRATAPGPANRIAPSPTRLDHLDPLRVALIVLVVAHHAAQAYGPPDWWYFRADRRSELLAAFSAVNGAFFMSLFFFLSASLVPPSRERRGTWPYLVGRLRRLGIPFVVGSLTLIPGLMYAHHLLERDLPPVSFPRYFVDFFLGFAPRPANWPGPSWPDLQFGHLWFLQHLLLYTGVYLAGRSLAARWLRPPRVRSARAPARLPTQAGLVTFTLAVAAATFAIRLRHPLDEWVPLLGFVQAEPARMAQYVAFFAAGILASRRSWVSRYPVRAGYAWLALGVVLAALPYAFGGMAGLGFDPGGPTLGSLAACLYENLLCTGLCVGLLILFREHAIGGQALLRSLAASSYAVYIVHVPIVVALQFSLAPAGPPPLAAFVAVSVLAVLASFGCAEVLRRLPGFRSVL